MNSREYKEFKKRAQHSVDVNKKLRDNSFWDDKELVNELFDDSFLAEEGGYGLKSKIRIGTQYQVEVPKFKEKKTKKP